jgi:hypothetical protein
LTAAVIEVLRERPLLGRLRRRLAMEVGQEREWKNIVELNHEFDTRRVKMKDYEGREYAVEGISSIRCYSGTEFIHLTLGPGCYMRLLRPSTARLEDINTLRISA